MPTVHLTDRAVLAVAGPDARAYLQDLVTNDVARLAPGAPLWAGLLSAQGKPLVDMVLVDGGGVAPGAVLVDMLAGAAEALAKRLTLYKLRRAVTIEARPDLAVFAAWGDAGGQAAAGDASVEPDERPADPQLAALGRRWVAPAGAVATDVSLADYVRHRLALGVPDSGDLLIDRMLWLEANAVELNGVSFTKGCYVGQENTARMHHRDKVRRRLLPVTLAGDVAAGTPVTAGGVAAGEVRRAEGGRGIAYLRVEAAAGAMAAGEVPVAVDWPGWLPRD